MFQGMRTAVLMLAALASTQPARAQMDFSGEWAVVRNQDNSENPLVGDWVAIPMSEAGLARSEAWDASIQSLPEWQCRPHGWAYIYRGPTALRIWRDLDPVSRDVIAFHAQVGRDSDLPGRPSASARVRAVFLDGVLHSRLGRRDAQDHHDAHEGRLS